MTHDELLAKINEYQPIIKEELFDKDIFGKWRVALRAVVELHPRKALGFSGRWSCGECLVEYPCKTIRAIEKELK